MGYHASSYELSKGCDTMSANERLSAAKAALLATYAKPLDRLGAWQVLNTLAPLILTWWALAWSAEFSLALTAALGVPLTLLTLRAFVLMHDCGHGSLFRTGALNKAFGFVLGVIVGVPQYVWSKRHAHHHATNGNWQRFRGVLDILSVREYEALNAARRRRYRWLRHVFFAPYGGFMYLVFRPRYGWLKGSCNLALFLLVAKLRAPGTSLRCHAARFRTRHWRSFTDYRHMCWTNLALLAGAAGMCHAVGTALFVSVYVTSLSLVGGALILLVHAQHNFPHAYAAGDASWHPDSATLHGTSWMQMPAWLNWFTADSAFHHIHHLSSAIPNYRLAECHHRNAELFSCVTRLNLKQIPATLRCVLWDEGAGRIISTDEHARRPTQRETNDPTIARCRTSGAIGFCSRVNFR